MELIRYIHLNPLRAKLIPDINALENYPWCGHAELMGKQQGIGLSLDAVLGLFGEKLITARQIYLKFIVDGIGAVKPDLTGGGLRRSQALGVPTEKFSEFDDRILGGSEFVKSLRRKGLLASSDPRVKMTLQELHSLVAEYYRLAERGLFNRGRQNSVAEARILFCYCGVKLLDNTGADVGRYLNIGSSSVTRSVRKGEQLVDGNAELESWVERHLKQ
jgi:hypothetical protein